jgi:hypothetical protein
MMKVGDAKGKPSDARRKKEIKADERQDEYSITVCLSITRNFLFLVDLFVQRCEQ